MPDNNDKGKSIQNEHCLVKKKLKMHAQFIKPIAD